MSLAADHRPSFTWTDDRGDQLPLTEEFGVKVLRGALGLDGTEVDRDTEERVNDDGDAFVGERRPARRIVLPVRLDHEGDVRSFAGRLRRRLRGPGTLTATDIGGARELRFVRYEGGLQGGRSDLAIRTRRKAAVSLVADDPWWYDVADEVVTLAHTASSTPFDDAATPFDDPETPFDGGTVTSMQVGGDEDTPALVTITGPFTSCTVIVQGGRRVMLAQPVAAGDVLEIDARRDRRGVWLNGQLAWSYVTNQSRPLLLPYDQTVNMIVAGDGYDSSSSVTVTYAARHEAFS